MTFTVTTVIGTWSPFPSRNGKTKVCRRQRNRNSRKKKHIGMVNFVLSPFYNLNTRTNIGVLTSIYVSPPPTETFYEVAWNTLQFVPIKQSVTKIINVIVSTIYRNTRKALRPTASHPREVKTKKIYNK